MFSKIQLTTSSGKNLIDTSHANIVSLLDKLITSSSGSDNLCISFHRQNHPDGGTVLNYGDHVFFQGYGQIKEAFIGLTT